MSQTTICIPTYNRSHLIGRAIESALGQTERDIDILVYDDVSTDNTESVVKKYKDRRVLYVRGDTNLKECRTRAAIVGMVKTEYLSWLDSDDISNRYRIAMQLAAMRENNALWCRTDSDVYRKDRIVDWRETPRTKEKFEFVTPTTTVRTDFAKKHTYKPYLFGCDTIWELEANLHHRPGIVINRILYYYMMHDPSRVSKAYPHLPDFEKQMAEQRRYRQELLDALRAKNIPFRGTTLDEVYTIGLVQRCCS